MPANLPAALLDALTARGLRVVRDRDAVTYTVSDASGRRILERVAVAELAAWVEREPLDLVDRSRPSPARDLGRHHGRASRDRAGDVARDPTGGDWRALAVVLGRDPTPAEAALYLDGWRLGVADER